MNRNGLFIIDLLSNAVGAFTCLFIIFAVMVGRTPPVQKLIPVPEESFSPSLFLSVGINDPNAWVRLRLLDPDTSERFFSHFDQGTPEKTQKYQDRHLSTIDVVENGTLFASRFVSPISVLSVSGHEGRQSVFIPAVADGCWQFEIVAGDPDGTPSWVETEVWLGGMKASLEDSTVAYRFDRAATDYSPSPVSQSVRSRVGIEAHVIYVEINGAC